MQSKFWRHSPIFLANVAKGLNTVQLLRVIHCEFVTTKFASHSQEVWTRRKTLLGLWYSFHGSCDLFSLVTTYLAAQAVYSQGSPVGLMNETNGLVIRGNIVEEPRASLNDGFQCCMRISTSRNSLFIWHVIIIIIIIRLVMRTYPPCWF